MKTFRAFALLAVSFALVSIFAAQARASLIQDFVLSGNSNLTGSGFFQFDQDSGNFADNLVAWGFTGTIFGHTFSFTDLAGFSQQATYSIDDNWGLSYAPFNTQIFVNTDTPGVIAFGFTLNVDAELELECGDTQEMSRCGGQDEREPSADVTFTPRHDVPEPSTWALFIIGLGAMVVVARRRRHKVIGQD